VILTHQWNKWHCRIQCTMMPARNVMDRFGGADRSRRIDYVTLPSRPSGQSINSRILQHCTVQRLPSPTDELPFPKWKYQRDHMPRLNCTVQINSVVKLWAIIKHLSGFGNADESVCRHGQITAPALLGIGIPEKCKHLLTGVVICSRRPRSSITPRGRHG
jgi:hypothetical protein